MIKDLNEIYDKGVQQVSPPPFTAEDWNNVKAPTYAGGQVSSRRPEEYVGYLRDGLSEAPGRNPETERGMAQSNWEKVGNGLAHTLVKSGTQLIDMAGGLTSLLTEFGDDRDYQNGFTKATDEINAWMDKHAPLYRSTEGTFGLGDLSWWMQNGSGLVSSMAGFAIGGAGIAKGLGVLGKLGKVGKGVEWLAGVATQDAKAARLVKNLLEESVSAGTLAYAEGAMSGRRVYDEVYNYQLKLGMDEPTARHLAAESAATTVQLNTIVNTGFNMLGGMGAFFDRSKDASLSLAKNEMKRSVGESTENFLTRLKSMEAKQFGKELGLQRTFGNTAEKLAISAKESFSEGMEELTNQWAEQVGVTEGQKGKDLGFFEQLETLSKYADYTMNAEGALNFMLGAVGGPLQHGALNYLPIHKVADGYRQNEKGEIVDSNDQVVEKPEDGATNYKRMSSHKLAKKEVTDRFDTIKNQVVEDVEWFVQTKDALKKAQDAGDVVEVENLKKKLLDASMLRSIKMGMGENLASMYEDLAKVSNDKSIKDELMEKASALATSITDQKSKGIDTTEDEKVLEDLKAKISTAKDQTAAMAMGLTDSKENNEYVEQAQQAVKDLKTMSDIRNKIFDKFGFTSNSLNPAEISVADFITSLAFQHYTATRDIKSTQAEIDKVSSNILENYTGVLDELAVAEKEVADYLERGDTLERKINIFNQLTEKLKRLDDPSITDAEVEEIQAMLEDHGLVVLEGETKDGFYKRMIDDLTFKKAQYEEELKNYTETVLTTDNYEKWKTETKGPTDFKHYLDHIRSTAKDSLYLKSLKDRMSMLEVRRDLSKSNYDKLMQSKTLASVLKNQENYYEKINKEQEKFDAARKQDIKNAVSNESAIRADNRKRLERLKAEAQQKIKDLESTIATLSVELATVKQVEPDSLLHLAELKKQQYDLLNRIAYASASISDLFNYIEKIDSALEYSIGVPPPPPPPPPISTNGGFLRVLQDLKQNREELGAQPGISPETLAQLDTAIKSFSVSITDYDKLVKEIESLGIPEVDPLATKLVQEIEDTGFEPPLNYFSTLPAEQSAKLVVLVKELVRLNDEFDKLEETIKKEAENAEFMASVTPDTEVELESIPIEDQLIDLAFTEVIQMTPSGEILTKKQAEPSTSGASKSTIFFWKRDGADIVTESTARLEDTAVLEVLDNTELLPGTEVTFELDLDFDMDTSAYGTPTGRTKAETKQLTRTADMLNEDGTIKPEFYDRVPIKIVSNGKTVQWVHTPQWVIQADPTMSGPEKYFHTIDEKVDSNGNVIIPAGNAQREANELENMRKNFVKRYNEGILQGKSKGWLKIPSKVIDKGQGSFVYPSSGMARAIILKEHRFVGGVHKVTPITLGVFQNGTMRGIETRPDIQVGAVPETYKNKVIAMVPMPNGKYVPVPLSGHKLSENIKGEKNETTDAWQTFNRVTELFLNDKADKSELDALEKALGYSVKTKEGFRRFITQYFTYFSQAEDTTSGVKLKTIKNLQTGKTDIHIETYEGTANRVVTLALDTDGNLTRESKAEIAHLFDNRYRAVSFTASDRNIKGLNSQGVFKEPLYRDGKWEVRNHGSYNEYLMQYLLTPISPINGAEGVERTDELGNKYKDYFYGANPIIKYDMSGFKVDSDPLAASLVVGTTNTIVPDSTSTTETVAEDVIGGVFEDELPSKETVGTSSVEINLENLTSMFNFTPESERNGKTPLEVYEKYKQLKMTHIAPGYNPFKRC